jgi:hypothetical protein
MSITTVRDVNRESSIWKTVCADQLSGVYARLCRHGGSQAMWWGRPLRCDRQVRDSARQALLFADRFVSLRMELETVGDRHTYIDTRSSN